MKRLKHFTRKVVVLTLSAAMLAAVAGCGGSSGAQSASGKTEAGAGASEGASDGTGKVITIADGALDGSLDPAGFALQSWNAFARLCSLPLISYDKSGEVIYEAAESFEVSDDQLTYTFHLRKDGKWSDGSAVTAGDFLNTITRALDSETSGSVYADQLFVIEGAQAAYEGTGSADDIQAIAEDDNTLVFHLTKPCAYFTKLLALPVYYPSKTGVAVNGTDWYKDPATCPCNGPYMLTEFVQDQYYAVEKNPYYFAADQVKIDRIVDQTITDTQSMIAAYTAGEVDVASGLPDYIETQYKDSDELFIWRMITTTAILPNVKAEPLDDALVREAIALALDRNAICASLGTNWEPAYAWVPKYMISNKGGGYFYDEVSHFSEDAQKAKELLAQAGYPDGNGFPTLTYTYPSNDKDAILAQAIQAQLKAVLNIEIRLEAQETEVYNTTKREGTFQLLRYNWTADFTDPINYLALYVSDSALNFNGVSDADYDAAIASANGAVTQEERNTYLHEAERILVDENFFSIPIFTMHYIGLRNPAITGVTYNDRDESNYRFSDLK